MLSRSAQVLVPACTQQLQQVRGMATLKEIRLRLKSVQNIKKITSSMKMVSAAKYARAERDLKAARAYGVGSAAFFDSLNVPDEEPVPAGGEKGNKLVIAMTSDKGLCGGVHSHICKNIKGLMNTRQPGDKVKLFLVGDKANQILTRLYKEDVVMVCKNIGKRPPSFNDASFIAGHILNSDVDFSTATMYYNIFKTVVSYETTPLKLVTEQQVVASDARYLYDSMDDDILKCYQEFMLASRVYYALKECACSEQSARMTAMDSASKNADEMINKLTLTFNRTRQAVITRELIEIISGAEAL